ncbi:MAG: peptide deformylase [Gammaproteobacteria bacterium]|nr:peptide deformylase [Gammaproteobacteria bacterium]
MQLLVSDTKSCIKIIGKRLMSTHEILYYPDPRLRVISHPIEKIEPDIQKLVDEMFDIMYQHGGGGLAAPQIGVPLRMTIIDDKEHKPFVLINPEIVELSTRKVKNEEGCLSVPGVSAEIERPHAVKVKALDISGEPFEIEASDNYLARCLQHEIDHLYGKLYIDYLSALKRERLAKDMKKFLKK